MENRFMCECGCITWTIFDSKIKCINDICRKEYNITSIEDSKFFNENRKVLLNTEPNPSDIGRIYNGPISTTKQR